MDPNGCWMWFSGLLELRILSGWWFGTWILFSHILGIMIPTDFHIFQRGSNHQPVWEASLFQERGGKTLVAEPNCVIFFAGYLRVRVRLAMNNANGMYVVQKIHIICINIYILYILYILYIYTYILTIIKTKTCISMVIWFSMYPGNAYMMFSLLLDVWNTESEWCNLTFELLKSWWFRGPFQ